MTEHLQLVVHNGANGRPDKTPAHLTCTAAGTCGTLWLRLLPAPRADLRLCFSAHVVSACTRLTSVYVEKGCVHQQCFVVLP
jgi:hypothetical protein